MYTARCLLLGLLASVLVINDTGLELLELMTGRAAISEEKPPLTFVCTQQIPVVNQDRLGSESRLRWRHYYLRPMAKENI
jgi:hypothetical protein